MTRRACAFNRRHAGLIAMVILLVLLIARPAGAIWTTSIGNTPVSADGNWPAGTAEVANLPSRTARGDGDGGWTVFAYRGGTEAFTAALDKFVRIRAPELRLVVHEAPCRFFLFKDDADWTLTLCDGQERDERLKMFGEKTGGPVDPPQLDVYVAPGDGRGVAWAGVHVPANVTVTDDRASAHGYQPEDWSVVRGQAVDQLTSKPVAGARVTIKTFYANDAGRDGGTGATGADGHFEIKHVPPGNYRVTIEAAGYAPRELGYIDFGKNTFEEYKAELVRAGILSGTTVDLKGKPVAGVRVTVTSVAGKDGANYPLVKVPETSSDAKGFFVLTGLPAGFVNLRANERWHNLVGPGKLGVPGSDVVLRMAPAADVKGKALNADGKPVKGVEVRLQPVGEVKEKRRYAAEVGEDGTFEFTNVPPGRYILAVWPFEPDDGVGSELVRQEMRELEAGETRQIEIRLK